MRFYEPIRHKPIHSLKQKATGYSGIKGSKCIWPYKKYVAAIVTITKLPSQTGSPNGD